jgi:hypothetical protein
LLNEAIGTPLGFLNPLIYPLAGTNSFHSAASMKSDPAHVGLGSPNGNRLSLALAAITPGAPSATVSTVTPYSSVAFAPFLGGIPADGSTEAAVVVQLLDANGELAAPGKSVTLSASPGSHAIIITSPAVTSSPNSSVTFMVNDATVENVTFTATDTTDGVTIAQTAAVNFTGPPATAGGIGANPASVAADGMSASTITVTLQDAKGNPAPNKEVVITQGGGHSNVNGPTPSFTDSSGKVQFTATNLITESVTYGAVDVTDGDLPVPGTASVNFTGGAPPACKLGPLAAVPGANFAYNNYVTGFPTTSENCLNPAGMAFDSAGNLYVADYAGTHVAAGGVYKFGPAGGTAGIQNRLNPVGYPPGTCASGLAFSKDGKHLYLARQGCGSGGDVVEISPTDGSVIRKLIDLYCATGLATDPISGDLFVSQPCDLPAPNNDITRIINPESATPSTEIYAVPGGSGQLTFGPDGTLYTESFRFDLNTRFLVAIDGTNRTFPGAFTYLTEDFFSAFGVLPSFNAADPSQPQFLLDANGGVSPTATGDISQVDLTQDPPAQTEVFNNGPALQYIIGGPDGCAYATEPDRIIRICKADGSGPMAPSTPQAALILSPASFTSNPAQGSPITLTVNFSNVTVPAGTPVMLTVIGPNLQAILGRTDAGGQANFSYTGIFTGSDVIGASATVGTQSLFSNLSHLTWVANRHTTFCNLNLSPKGTNAGKSSTVTASLFDVSATPVAPVGAASLKFTLEGNSCTGATNASGSASCVLTPSFGGNVPLTASFAGNANFLPANASTQFLVIGATATPTPTPTPQVTSTGTATATPARTASPAPSRTPVPTNSPAPTHTRMPTLTPTATHTPVPTSSATPTGTPTHTPKPTPTPTAPACVASTPAPTVPVPTPTPPPGNPAIASVSNPVLVGSSFTVNGRNFSPGSVVNFFVATAAGPANAGPLRPAAVSTSTRLVVPVPATVSEGQGFVSVEVINTDKGFTISNLGYALLQGSAAAGLPTITQINGHGLAATSKDPSFATANVETTLAQGSAVTLKGSGFDIKNGVAVDVFCACTGGKLPTTFLNPGNPNLTSTSIVFTLPSTAPTGPGSIVVSNAGAAHSYAAKSEAVSVPIGARIIITKVAQTGTTIMVDGAGFSTLTVINFFNSKSGAVLNLGGLTAAGKPVIKLTFVNSTRFTLTKPAGAVTGASFIQALNPPFLPFTSTSNDPCGAFTLE